MMSQKNKEKGKTARTYFGIIAFLFILIGVAIVVKATTTYMFDGHAWRQIGENYKNRNRYVHVPDRGNIYSADYELMATTKERHRILFDFWAESNYKILTKKDVGIAEWDSIVNLSVEHLKTFLPDSTVSYYKRRMESGKQMFLDYEKKKIKKRNRRYSIFNQELDYVQLKKLKETHLFNSKLMKGMPGLETEERMVRIKPFGTLANRTIGGVYGKGEIDGKRGNSGLELYYDSLLKGKEGVYIVERLDGKGKRTYIEEVIHGKDIVTTIDTDIQELAERVLLETLKDRQAESGTAIVMEVETGYVKAIANMGYERGVWAEHKNYGVSYMNEPGSTFKVISMMIALEDGLVHPHTVVETGNGVWSHKGISIKDHNAHRGGYGTIDAALSIVYSSNIGVAKLIYQAYGSNPQKFVDGIMRTGAFGDLKLEIPGYGVPRLRKVNGGGWSSYSLEKMSYGYENMIPPINILTFFNGIANNGEVVKPLFVKEILEDGEVIEKKEKVVLNPKMCSPETLASLKEMMYDVVNAQKGTGKPVKSQFLSIAGKTATAQILGAGGALLGHQVGFCGYFPAENPKYSCVVTVRRPKEHNPSGGRIAGGVFKQIAEGMYAKNLLDKVYIFPVDTLRSHEPIVKKSLDALDLEAQVVPDVKGMGGKDAVYALEELGLKVNLEGKGTVRQQSLNPGTKVKGGETIKLELR